MRFMSVGTMASSSPSSSSASSSVGTWVPCPLKWKNRTSPGSVMLTSLLSSVCRHIREAGPEGHAKSRRRLEFLEYLQLTVVETGRCSQKDQKQC